MKRLYSILVCILALVVITPVSAATVNDYSIVSEIRYSPGYTETLRPNAAGDVTQCLKYPDSGENYEKVDEITQDNSDYVRAYVPIEGGDIRRDLYNFPAVSPADAITKVVVYFIVWREGSGWGKAVIKTGGIEYYGDTKSPALSTWVLYSEEWLVNPGTGEAWTNAEVNALQAGVQLKASTPNGSRSTRCSWLYVTVHYILTPAINTVAASNIAKTTARLNSTVTDDGGEDCDVRWGYGDETQTAENFESYDNVTAWDTTGYSTGQHPYFDATGLAEDVEYFFRVQIGNTADNVTGSELTFTTETDIIKPSNFKVYPSATSVSLSWTKGAGASQTMVRFRYDTYPTTNTSGTQAYLGAGSSFIHEDLDMGTTIYYGAWSESGGIYSANYVTAMVTTSASGVAGEDLPTPTVMPGWMQSPNPEALENFEPVYTIVNNVADAYEIPRGTFWLGLSLLVCIGMGGILFAVSGSLLAGSIVEFVCLIVGVTIELLPGWMAFFTALFSVGVGVCVMKLIRE